MRKTLLLFALILIMTACGGKKNDPANLADLKPVDAKGESFLFKYTFQKGQELKYKLTTINSADEEIKADSVSGTKVNETANYTIALSALDVDKDSVAEFNVTVTAVDLDSKVNGNETKYSSSDTKMKPEEKKAFIQYEAILNNPFRMRVNGKGEVLEVSRVDKIVDKILALNPPPKPLTIDEKNTLIKNISEGAIQPLVQQLFRLMPDKKLKVDSTWTYSYPNQVGQLLITNKVVFKFDELLGASGNKIAKISAQMIPTISGNKNMTDGKIDAVFDDPKISGGGTAFFDVEAGILQKSETWTSQEFRIVLTSRDPAQGKKKVARKQSSKNTLIVELIK